MAKDAAFQEAEKKIAQALADGATELDLSCGWNADDSEKLTELPESLGRLTQLQTLNLSGNQLTALPELLGQLTQLRTLSLRNNQLTELPESLGQLTQLQTLNLEFNQLTSLPISFDQLTQLRTLFVGPNRHMAGVPQVLRKMPWLEYIDLQSCGIKTLPDWFGEISGLRQGLYLASNQLTDLPASLANLQQLEAIYLHDNPLDPELSAAYEQGLDAVKAYLRAKAEDQIVLNEAKLILIGEGEVGKTSLLGALRGDKWIAKRPTTHGVEVDIKTVVLTDADTGTKITFNGWDFGGQNIYRHTHQMFFTAPAVYLAVWNPRRGPEQCCVDEWIKMVRQRAFDDTRPDERPRILVVATHGGPEERSAHIDEQLLRDEFGDLIAGFHHVDSETEYGLDELKAAIAREAAAIPSVGRSVPTSWKNLIDALQQRSEQDPYISYNQFREICKDQSINPVLVQYYSLILNELGYLIRYQGDEILQETVILKPEYISKAISYVLEDSRAKEDNGLVEHDRLGEIWDDPARPQRDRYPDELHPIFLRLMDRFDLSYQVAMPNQDDPATSLVAQLVPGGRPKDWEQDWPAEAEQGDAERRRICRLVDVETGRPAEVEGLLYRLIVRLHRYSLGRRNYLDSRHWKTGMIVDDEFNGRAFIEEIAGDVHVSVRAAYPDGFLGSLCHEVRSLVDQFWKGLDCRLSVPCHSPCRGVHELEELIETKHEGMPKVRCAVCKKFYEIDALLAAATPTPKLPMNLVLSELTKARGDLAAIRSDTTDIKSDTTDIKKDIKALDTDLRAMIGQANEQFELMMNAMTSLAKDGPRLFSFEPVKPGFFDRPKSIAEQFRLTLWCEHSRMPLPMLTGEEKRGVYKVEIARDWIKRSAPVLKVLASTLSLALPIASSALRVGVGPDAYQSIENQLSFGKECAECYAVSGQNVGEWLASGDETEMAATRAVLAEGSALRELHGLLKEKDKSNRFGGLVRVQNKRREFLWVHPQYADKY